METPFVRVRDSRTGHQYSTPTVIAEADENLTILPEESHPAVDRSGRVLRPKYNMPLRGKKNTNADSTTEPAQTEGVSQ